MQAFFRKQAADIFSSAPLISCQCYRRIPTLFESATYPKGKPRSSKEGSGFCSSHIESKIFAKETNVDSTKIEKDKLKNTNYTIIELENDDESFTIENTGTGASNHTLNKRKIDSLQCKPIALKTNIEPSKQFISFWLEEQYSIFGKISSQMRWTDKTEL